MMAGSENAPLRSRLAPSPTGYLHLGNAWSFLLCWLGTRAGGGRLVLRMEDIDPDRSRLEYADAIRRDLEWLGLDWDEGPGGPYAPYVQSEKGRRYTEVLQALYAAGQTYPCYCTRKELKSMASAPHAEDAGPIYPGTCLTLSAAQRLERERGGRKATVRLNGAGTYRFADLIQGEVDLSWEQCGGDFPLRRSDGVISYQLAVAVDDLDQRISLVVRGADILPSTPRQMRLLELLGTSVPRYAHVPLLLDHEGERLAKRHQSRELRALRAAGVSPCAIVGYLGYRAGLIDNARPCVPAELLAAFAWEKLPKNSLCLEPEVETLLLRLS